MKQLPIDAKQQESSLTHLFEIELATIVVVSAITTTKYVVDDIDKCFVGQSLSKVYYDIATDYYKYDIVTVTAVDTLANIITISAPFTEAAINGTILCETLYNSATFPVLSSVLNSEFLQLYHAALGTLTGKITVTDYDVPIVTEIDRASLYGTSLYNGKVVYLPISIAYNGTEHDDKGKASTIDISLTNIDQLLGNLILTHNGLKERAVTVKTAFINNLCSPYSVVVPINTNDFLTTISRTNDIYEPILTYNDSFLNILYVPASNVRTDFEGSVDNASADGKVASLQATVTIDSTENIVLPNRMYNRLRCPFIYKSWRCRFNSQLILNQSITNYTDGLVRFKSNNLFFYFKNIQEGETHIIRIEDELIEIDGFAPASGVNVMDNEDVRKLSYTDIDTQIASNLNVFDIKIKTRGYGGTTAVSHTSGKSVDILMCRKTDHDCNMHGHDAYFGAFPAIPKNKSYVG